MDMSDQNHEVLSGGRNRGICRNPTIPDSTEIKSLLAIEYTKQVVLMLFLYGSEAPCYEVPSRLLRFLPPRKTMVHTFELYFGFVVLIIKFYPEQSTVVCCSTPQGSPGVGRNTFLSSPHLCFIIVFICDLFVSRDDPLMS